MTVDTAEQIGINYDLSLGDFNRKKKIFLEIALNHPDAKSIITKSETNIGLFVYDTEDHSVDSFRLNGMFTVRSLSGVNAHRK